MSLQEFQIFSDDWIEITHYIGQKDIETIIRKLVNGSIHPKEGFICSTIKK